MKAATILRRLASWRAASVDPLVALREE